ncbi:MAG TPA: magnesium chelatase [Planctomycetota bacterium]|nr:magnesium chelatase [Planctomycetota bacterium]
MTQRPRTLGELKKTGYRPESVRSELRRNMLKALREKGLSNAGGSNGSALFPGIVGFDKTVLPQIVNAVLAHHDFILLGLRGQAKTRIARALVSFLDPEIPVLAGFPLNEDPLAPISTGAKAHIAANGDATEIRWLSRDERYREKLATPDVTIADLIGDIDPIKAANKRLDYASEEVIHYGIIPRTNRGIFCINELPDLPARIQVGLLNIMQERDLQIRGFPVRIPIDILMVYTANPEDYTNRGSIITPLKDRIDSQIMTHYPAKLADALTITDQEAWTDRGDVRVHIPKYLRETIEEVAFQARKSEFLDQSSGVSARLSITLLENVVSSAERRAVISGEKEVAVRPIDLQAAVSAVTGKVELVYEGEQEGALSVARHLIGRATKTVFDRYLPDAYKSGSKEDPSFGPYKNVINYFAQGKNVEVSDEVPAAQLLASLRQVGGLEEIARKHLPIDRDNLDLASAMEFVIEGLHQSRIVAKDELEGHTRYRDMLGSMFEGMDEGKPPRPPRERGRSRDRDDE